MEDQGILQQKRKRDGPRPLSVCTVHVCKHPVKQQIRALAFQPNHASGVVTRASLLGAPGLTTRNKDATRGRNYSLLLWVIYANVVFSWSRSVLSISAKGSRPPKNWKTNVAQLHQLRQKTRHQNSLFVMPGATFVASCYFVAMASNLVASIHHVRITSFSSPDSKFSKFRKAAGREGKQNPAQRGGEKVPFAQSTFSAPARKY